MDSFANLNQQLQDIGMRIELKNNELNTYMKNFLICEAEYDHAVAGEQLRIKATFPELSQLELKARAIEATFQKRLETIRFESTYKKAMNDIKAMRDRLDALKEVSYNLRKEATI